MTEKDTLVPYIVVIESCSFLRVKHDTKLREVERTEEAVEG
jgi:hypothetical protein